MQKQVLTEDEAHPQAALYRGRQHEPSEDKQATAHSTVADTLAVDATPFVNRLRKNRKALKGWLKQNGIKGLPTVRQ